MNGLDATNDLTLIFGASSKHLTSSMGIAVRKMMLNNGWTDSMRGGQEELIDPGPSVLHGSKVASFGITLLLHFWKEHIQPKIIVSHGAAKA